MLKIKEATFVKSIIDLKDRPKPFLPEFTFAGRSNVGKSSLINCLVNRNNFARVSKKPGKTRIINYFLINNDFYLVDLPGYGFARIPDADKQKWRSMVEDYIINNKYLIKLFVLIDSRIGMQKNDLQLIHWLQDNLISYQLILTKSDKINRNIQNKRKEEIRATLPFINNGSIINFSAKSKYGRQDILSIMNELMKSY